VKRFDSHPLSVDDQEQSAAEATLHSLGCEPFKIGLSSDAMAYNMYFMRVIPEYLT